MVRLLVLENMIYRKLWFNWDKPTYMADPQNWKELKQSLEEGQFLDRDPRVPIPQEETDEILNILL